MASNQTSGGDASKTRFLELTVPLVLCMSLCSCARLSPDTDRLPTRPAEGSLPSTYIDLKEAAYGLPLNVTPQDVMEWSHKNGLVIGTSMESTAQIRALVMSFIVERGIAVLHDSEFSKWDPNADWALPQLEALERRLSELTFGSSYEDEQALSLCLALADQIGALKSPVWVDGNGTYPLRPVFRVRDLASMCNASVRYADAMACLPYLQKSAKVTIRRPHLSGDHDPLSLIDIVFVKTHDNGWRSCAASVLFNDFGGIDGTAFENQKRTIIRAMDEKYGPAKLITAQGEDRPYTYERQAMDVMDMLYHLTGARVDCQEHPMSITLWSANIFAGPEALGWHHQFYKGPGLVLIHYYDAKLAAEIVKAHAQACTQLSDRQKREETDVLNGIRRGIQGNMRE